MDTLSVVVSWILNVTGVELVASYANYIVAMYVLYKLCFIIKSNMELVASYSRAMYDKCVLAYKKLVKIYVKLNALVEEDNTSEPVIPDYVPQVVSDVPQLVKPLLPPVIKNPNQLTPVGNITGAGVDYSTMYQSVEDLEQNYWNKVKRSDNNLQKTPYTQSMYPGDVYGPDGCLYDGAEYSKLMMNPYSNFDKVNWNNSSKENPTLDIRPEPDIRDITNRSSYGKFNGTFRSSNKLYEDKMDGYYDTPSSTMPENVNFALDGGDTRAPHLTDPKQNNTFIIHEPLQNGFSHLDMMNSKPNNISLEARMQDMKRNYIKIEEDNDTEEDNQFNDRSQEINFMSNKKDKWQPESLHLYSNLSQELNDRQTVNMDEYMNKLISAEIEMENELEALKTEALKTEAETKLSQYPIPTLQKQVSPWKNSSITLDELQHPSSLSKK